MARTRLRSFVIPCGFGALIVSGLLFLAFAPRTYTSAALVQVQVDPHALYRIDRPGRGLALADLILDSVGAAEVIGPEVDKLGLDMGGRRGAFGGLRPAFDRTAAIARARAALRVGETASPAVWRVMYTSPHQSLSPTVLNDLITRVSTTDAADAARGRAQIAESRTLTVARDQAAQASQTVAALVSLEETSAAVLRDHVHKLGLWLGAARGSGNATRPPTNGDAGDEAKLAALLAERTNLRTEQTALAQRYGPRHPASIALDQRMDRLNALIEAETRLAARPPGAPAKLAGLLADRADAQALLEAETRRHALLQTAVAQTQAAQAQVQTALDRRTKLNPVASLRITSLAPAATPLRPDVSPARMGAMATAILSAAALVVESLRRRRRDNRFETAADVEQRLGRRVAAVIPAIVSGRRDVQDRRPPDRPLDAICRDANSPFARAFCTLRQELGLGEGDLARAVAVCSALPGEGKTTVSACLARSSALSGRRVILIDCDGRQRALSALFKAPDSAGLVQLLRGDVSLDQATIIDPQSGVHVVRHSATPEVQDLSASTAMGALLARLRREFDVVILDTGPVLALAEARVVAALADEVLLVARWRQTPVRAAKLALDLLDKAAANVRSVAFTLAPAS